MEGAWIYDQMYDEGLYPAAPKLSELTGTAEDKAAAKTETDALWEALGKVEGDGS